MNWLRLVTVSLCLAVSVGSVRSQYDKEFTMSVREGEDFVYICNQTVYPDTDIYWFKNNSGKVVGGNVLNLTDIQRDQAGDYMCEAYNDTTKVTDLFDVVHLDVMYPAKVLSLSISSHQVTENETYSFLFELEGNPTPIWLLKNNRTNDVLNFTQSSGNITVGPIKANCSDTSVYILQVYNDVKLEPDYKTVNLSVLCSPRPIAGVNEYSVDAILGMHAYLVMNELGLPYPNFTWSRTDRKPLPDYVKSQSLKWLSALEIEVREVDDFTLYDLYMENKLGNYTQRYILNAKGPPQAPTNLRVTNITYNSAIIHWTSGYDMGSPQTFTVLKWYPDVGTYIQISDTIPDVSSDHGIGYNYSYLQQNLDSDTENKLVVVSTNRGGFHSQYQTPGLVFYTPARPHTPHGDRYSNSFNVGIIAGASLAAVGVVTVAVALLIYFLKSNRRRQRSYAKY